MPAEKCPACKTRLDDAWRIDDYAFDEYEWLTVVCPGCRALVGIDYDRGGNVSAVRVELGGASVVRIVERLRSAEGSDLAAELRFVSRSPIRRMLLRLPEVRAAMLLRADGQIIVLHDLLFRVGPRPRADRSQPEEWIVRRLRKTSEGYFEPETPRGRIVDGGAISLEAPSGYGRIRVHRGTVLRVLGSEHEWTLICAPPELGAMAGRWPEGWRLLVPFDCVAPAGISEHVRPRRTASRPAEDGSLAP
ncbi:MAG TPA: hypothetical protein VMV18_10550 [bacterium]|nr:hypothetical protein [bacterium]